MSGDRESVRTARERNPQWRYYARHASPPEPASWVVVDNWTGAVVGEFGSRLDSPGQTRIARTDARELVKELNGDRESLCVCGHPKEQHADCGTGPCRTNASLALWHDGNDRKSVPCRCRSYHAPTTTRVT